MGKVGTWFDEFFSDMMRKASAVFYFGLAIMLFWGLIEMVYLFWGFDLVSVLKDIPYVYPTFAHVFDEIAAKTGEGIIYLFTMSSLFFFPVPLELLFLQLLREGHPFSWLMWVSFAGLFAGQLINYILGLFFGPFFRQFIKTKTERWIKENVDRYGVIVVFFFNFLPFPFPVFNFAMGLFRYSFWMWAWTVTIAFLLKFVIIYQLYVMW